MSERARRIAARGILLAVVPVIIDVSVNPDDEAGIGKTWLRGSLLLGITGALAWAARNA